MMLMKILFIICHHVKAASSLNPRNTRKLAIFPPSCSKNEEKYNKRHDDIILNVKSIENSLSQVIHQKVTSLAECTDQHYKLRVRMKTRHR